MPPELKLSLKNSAYKPGSPLEGEVRWKEQETPAELTLSLLWYTSGKGTEDVGVVESKTLPLQYSSGSASFSFKLPESPYSFSGELISLIWAVEAIGSDKSDPARMEFVLSPSGKEIILTKVSK